MSMTTQEIMEILPHRHPFLLIDTVEEVEPGVRAVAKKNVTFNEPFLPVDFRESGYAGRADRGSTGTDRCGCNSFAAGMERKDGIFCRNQ